MNFAVPVSVFLAASAALATEAQPSFRNPGFEDGADGWTLPSALWRVEEGAGRGGSAALVWENDDPAAYLFPRHPIAIEPGDILHFSAWAKVDSLVGGDKSAGPKVSIDYANADGEWIGAEYAKAVDGPDPDGWTLYEGVTAPVPADAAGGNLFGFVPKRRTGRVRFDDFRLEKVGKRHIDALASDACYDGAESGKVRFVASLFLAPGTALESLAPVFEFTLADGTRIGRSPDEFDFSHALVSIDAELLARGTHLVGFALRSADGRELDRAAMTFTHGAAARRVSFDRFWRTLVRGVPFFPLGCYARDVTPETLRLYADGTPYNCIMPYHAPDSAMLDLCEEKGLMAVICVKDHVYGSQFAKKDVAATREASLESIAMIAQRAKGHPAVLAYYTNDESPQRQAGMLREVRAMLHAIDGDHPVWHVIDKRHKILPMVGAFDVIGMDPYPVGLESRLPAHSAVGEASRAVFAARDAIFGIAPVWEVVQAFDWTWDGRWNDACQRFPTREEISSMTWQAIAAGANGIFYYAFHRICMGAPPEMRDDYLRRVADAASEVREMMPVLLSEPGPAVVSAPDGAVCRSWRTSPGEVVVLAANTTRGEVAGAVTLAGGASAEISLPPLGHSFLTFANHP